MNALLSRACVKISCKLSSGKALPDTVAMLQHRSPLTNALLSRACVNLMHQSKLSSGKALPAAAAMLRRMSLLMDAPASIRAQSAFWTAFLLGNLGPHRGSIIVQESRRQRVERKGLCMLLLVECSEARLQ
eukprot:1159584-Pelagomonas_calceolata.AAC.15